MTAVRIIIVNFAIFLSIKGIWLITPGLAETIINALALPSTFGEAAAAPWSVLSYMFVHIDFWHLLVNALWLAWFGSLLERIAGWRWMLTDIIAGGLAGAVSYLTLPLAVGGTEPTLLLGASAATLAVISATLVSAPDKRIQMPLIGTVSLKLLSAAGLGIFVCASLEMTAAQTAAHAGGLVAGTISAFIWKHLSRRKMEQMKALTRERVTHMSLVEKARRSGYASLSRNEQLKLFDLSNRDTTRHAPFQ